MSFCVTVFSTFCDSVWIFSAASNLGPFNFIFMLTKKSQGGQKLLYSQSGVRGCIVMLGHRVVLAPFVWPLTLHILPKPPHVVAVELRIEGLTWRDEFLMDNTVNVEKLDQH